MTPDKCNTKTTVGYKSFLMFQNVGQQQSGNVGLIFPHNIPIPPASCVRYLGPCTDKRDNSAYCETLVRQQTDISHHDLRGHTVCGESYFSTTEASPLLLLGNEEWLEKPSLGGFRLWHLIFMVIASLLVTAICLCCCIRFRIPRTKQEIEADYVRKRITRKFQKQLQLIQNSEMDEMDLKKALERIRAEFRSDTESIAQSEAFSVASVGSSGLPMSPTDDEDNRRKSSEIEQNGVQTRIEELCPE
ncbi:hypothetical protein AAG570_003465 [Ranatra chinensis]|uniref:Transmembrane inner ear expressed protein n=1 Tax=Ranatra chinensis TaxID=642074 RepID=A0ABD0Y5Z7_9HEMI